MTAYTSHNDNTLAVKQGLGCHQVLCQQPDHDGANTVAPTAVGAVGRRSCSAGEHGWASPQHGDHLSIGMVGTIPTFPVAVFLFFYLDNKFGGL